MFGGLLIFLYFSFLTSHCLISIRDPSHYFLSGEGEEQ